MNYYCFRGENLKSPDYNHNHTLFCIFGSFRIPIKLKVFKSSKMTKEGPPYAHIILRRPRQCPIIDNSSNVRYIIIYMDLKLSWSDQDIGILSLPRNNVGSQDSLILSFSDFQYFRKSDICLADKFLVMMHPLVKIFVKIFPHELVDFTELTLWNMVWKKIINGYYSNTFYIDGKKTSHLFKEHAATALISFIFKTDAQPLLILFPVTPIILILLPVKTDAQPFFSN